MSTKIVNICIPECEQLPDIVSSFTPEENYLMLKIGSDCLKEGRKAISTLTQKEIYNKLKEETKKDIQKLEMDLLVQERSYNKSEERIRNVYEIELDKQRKEIDNLQNKILKFTTNSNLLVHPELEKKDIVISEKENQILKLTNIIEKISKQNDTKSSADIGIEGEVDFEILANTFRDFQGYRIENKSQIGHKGDYHLFFKDFNILVDAKNYSGSVQKKEIDKIESDLTINNTMDFGWLISLKTNFNNWNQYPIMYKWIVTDIGMKCILIINNLYSNKNPTDTLRLAWAITNELNKLLKKTKMEDDDIKLLKDRDFEVIQNVKLMQKRMGELKRSITGISQIVRDTDNDIIKVLSLLTNEIVKETYNKNNIVKNWWNSNIEFNKDNTSDKLTSMEIWYKFKKTNKEFIDENNYTVDDFKEVIKELINKENYIEKTKGGSIEFIGFNFIKQIQPYTEINLEHKAIKDKIKEVIINTNNTLNNEIINQYNTTDKNVLELSSEFNIEVYKIVTLLVNAKIISKREDAKGYDLYKQTDVYKSKITKK